MCAALMVNLPFQELDVANRSSLAQWTKVSTKINIWLLMPGLNETNSEAKNVTLLRNI